MTVSTVRPGDALRSWARQRPANAAQTFSVSSARGHLEKLFSACASVLDREQRAVLKTAVLVPPQLRGDVPFMPMLSCAGWLLPRHGGLYAGGSRATIH
jgi:hypothetical protein